MPNYKLAKIYKIKNEKNDSVYVGSTCKRVLYDRLVQHFQNANNQRNRPRNSHLHQLIRKIGWHCFEIELLEACPCSNNTELLLKEQHWMDQYPSDKLLNQRRATARPSASHRTDPVGESAAAADIDDVGE